MRNGFDVGSLSIGLNSVANQNQIRLLLMISATSRLIWAWVEYPLIGPIILTG